MPRSLDILDPTMFDAISQNRIKRYIRFLLSIRSLASIALFLLLVSAAGCTHISIRPKSLMRTVLEMMPHADGVGTQQFSRVMDSVTGTTASTGNRVQLLTNGDEAFPEMLAAIEDAKKRISMEMYIIRMDGVGRRFVKALSNAAKRGVTVRFLYDALGSRTIGDEDLDVLYAAGAEIRVFNPFVNWTVVRLNNRNHRKILVVDGRIAFLGGLNLAEDYDGDGTSGWRDSAIVVEGPAALEAEGIFEESWIQGGWGFLGKDLPVVGLYHFKGPIDDTLLWLFGESRTFCIPEHAPMVNGTSAVRVVSSAPDRISSPILEMYLLAVNSARKFISITNGYFTPPWILRRALVNAAKRGVRVRLILQGRTDVATARTKILSYYGALLKGGVEIYEWTKSVLHAKTMVVDGVWATVGSANLNRRGFFLNYEANVAVINPQFAAAMERQFEKDLKYCCRVTLENWKKRPFKQKALEILLMPFAGQF